jgi:hypothetical protein
MGLEAPAPGRGVFQTTFCVSFHWSGSFAPVLVANPSGPRNLGQSPVEARDWLNTPPAKANASRRATRCGFLMVKRWVGS